MLIRKNSVVLFQGDSITDAGRAKSNPDSMGNGYAMMAATAFTNAHPEMNVKFFNRGISGHRAKDLDARWKKDCLDIAPDIVSIMIGINDTWRRYDSNDPTSAEVYEHHYRNILAATQKTLGAKLVLIEPFVLPHPPDRIKWREDLDPKIAVVRKLAKEFNATLLPLDGILAEACRKHEPAYWAQDGVHPTPNGHAFIADEWIKLVSAE